MQKIATYKFYLSNNFICVKYQFITNEWKSFFFIYIPYFLLQKICINNICYTLVDNFSYKWLMLSRYTYVLYFKYFFNYSEFWQLLFKLPLHKWYFKLFFFLYKIKNEKRLFTEKLHILLHKLVTVITFCL